ncbi:MAG: D-glycerate dehydrogenase [Phycisphaeraceae bacterium]|nr:D-glycerate dehydrogenase [Phycisphaeraceae bacterium]MCW5754294.1 D-glycerate dehydrogenase [Phycisphaeraceae bacterium]
MSTEPIVVITRRIPGELHIPGATVSHGPDELLPRERTLVRIRGASIVVTMFSDRVDADFLDAAGPQLKGVCNFAVGVDNFDLAECARRGVVVANTPHAVTEGTADLAWTLILAAARRLPAADRYARSPEYPARGPLGMAEFLGQDLTGRTLLIVGAGRIGYATALRSLGWGMRVLYVARSRHWDFELAPLAASRVDLEEGLREADVVSLHTPLTPDTRHLINARRLAIMKPNAILVNTARGPVIDEAALVDALRNGRIWGAGLDVFEHEPQVHPGLLTLDNVALAPHIGSAAARYREMMTQMVQENAVAILQGRRPPFAVG